METVVLSGIGAVAFGYIAYLIWRGIKGKDICNCGGGGSCQGSSGNCHCGSKR